MEEKSKEEQSNIKINYDNCFCDDGCDDEYEDYSDENFE